MSPGKLRRTATAIEPPPPLRHSPADLVLAVRGEPLAFARSLRPFALYAPSGAPRGQTATPFALYALRRTEAVQGAKGGAHPGCTPRVHPKGCPKGCPKG